MVATCFFVFMSNYITASISPILVPIIVEFDISVTKATYLITCNILTLGLGNLFWVPLAQKIGKRPVLVICAAVFFEPAIWSAKASSWGSLLGARIVQGWGASCSEALGVAIVRYDSQAESDTSLTCSSLMIAGGSAIGGIFAGLIGHYNTDWRWVFWMDAILTGVCLLLTVIFQAETNFSRPLVSEVGEGMEVSQFAELRSQLRGSWTKGLGMTGWYDRDTSIWHLWLRPLLLLQFPAVVWASITYGITLGWVVLQQTANATAFPEVYGFTEFGVGNLNISYLIGAILGCAFGGPASDWVVHWITKRRKGYFEPEFRLWLIIPSAILGPVGLLMWGCGLGNHLDPYIAIVGSGITYGVLCAVPAVGMTYVVDCYKPLSGESITVLTAFKNTFAFAVSFAVNPWLTRDGYAKVSGYMVLIEGLLFLTTIPMYIYGARARRWTAKLVT
ncbi:uncharacterized protein Z519_06004 [Cladophialophora bantiana CBS 173.52]|uniref:Major facilitator superfamily (MFS) profile domain-containing protein n=1 Tax=Cladophialophora bantiana (strain ATCC 10958 / CBS 173.52 / CDC B-1940 / NIH 8579) TaxID=1442370 RepID=A0A0D2I9E2_CLAB1|nr:uncharacterized protein Z519_06004 [Cladophialophora bantiana CBS 173.52]KIW93399.1 hypothetical protein Z519_06004 [Cladophialophora bantiana CBS 173.52]